PSKMITGNVSGPCMSGFYYVKALPKTNLYLLVIEDWMVMKQSLFYNFNCNITRSVVNSGAYLIINGTCAHKDTSKSTLRDMGKCPRLSDVPLKCGFNLAVALNLNTSHCISVVLVYILLVIFNQILF
ncbi:voltage-dependent calcium channel subunit alpha-2/delta-2-like, partial [Elysia marginata]